MTRSDITGLLVLLMGVLIIVALTIVGLFLGSCVASAMMLIGVRSSAADWLAHLSGLFVVAFIITAMIDRIQQGRWWFE